MYIEQIKKLVELQELDSELLILKERLVEAPKHLEELKNKFTNLQEELNQLEEKLNILKEQKSKLEHDIEEDANRIRKSKNKLMMVENAKEYHAMMRELDNLEKLNRLREEELSNLVEDLQAQQSIYDHLAEEMASLDKEIAEQQSSLDTELKQIQSRIQKLEKNRKKASAKVPPPILARYNFIRERLSNPVIVSVTNGVCNGCFISIPPQTFIELQKGEQILSCPNCQRLIYWEEHFSPQKKKKD
jgi:predicted  nucleic acid-binding Zn-ribbon protein